jgi:hypothetical protein
VNIINPALYSKFILEFKRDDGLVIYINGTKQASSNMPSTVTYLTKALGIAADDGNLISSISLSKSAFVSGNNVIAVEVHQAVDANVDLSFDLRLLADLAPLAKITAPSTIYLPKNSAVLDGSTSTDSDGTIVKYAWAQLSGPSISSVANPNASKATISGMVKGSYVFRLTVTDNNGATGTKDLTLAVRSTSSTLFVDWKNITLPTDGLPDARRWASDRLRSSTAYDAFSRTLATDKLKIVVDSKVPVDPKVSAAQYHYRAEFTEWPWRINLPEGTEQWFGWSYYFAADYVRAVSPISIFQNHAGGSNGSPTFQLELTKPGQLAGALGGEVQVINNVSSPKVRKLTTVRPKPGDRMDIICHVVHARDAKGLLEFWINGIKIYSQIGSTIYPAPENWGGNNKWGIYHHTWTDPANVLTNIAAGHTKFELLMGNLRQITRSPNDAKYLTDSKALVDPTLDLAAATARTDQTEVVTALADELESSKGFVAYPSPVKRGDHLTILDANQQNFEAVLINQTGQPLKKISVIESAIISTEELAAGLYYLRKQNGSRQEVIKILVVD